MNKIMVLELNNAAYYFDKGNLFAFKNILEKKTSNEHSYLKDNTLPHLLTNRE